MTNTTTNTTTNAAKYVATYKVLGRGATKRFYAVLPTASPAKAGESIELHASYGGVNFGTLVAAHKLDTAKDGTAVTLWEFAQVKPTAEQYAKNKVLKLQAAAKYAASKEGLETARKVLARLEGKSTPEATAAPAPVAAVAPAPGQDIATLAAAMRAAGFSAAEVMAAISSAPAPVQAAAPAPVAPKAPAPKAPKATKQAHCVSCLKAVPALVKHETAGLNVCSTCVTLDADTVTTRVKRNAVELGVVTLPTA